jgi:hypothetical protein
MKLHSVLLGWIGILTKSCVSPQVFHGSMRLAGCPESIRGYCRRCEAFPVMKQTWQPQAGVALELEDMVKRLNARKHRHKEQATRG